MYREMATGRVEDVLVMPFGTDVSQSVDHLTVLVGEGVRGDRHGGTRLSDVRDKVLKAIGVGKEVPTANVREFTAVAAEELQEVGATMGAPGPLPYGLLGENLVISGVPSFSRLPPGTLLSFSKPGTDPPAHRKAVLAVWEENNPCAIPHDNITAHFRRLGHADFHPARSFQRAAYGCRGINGFVFCSGKIKPGDTVTVWGRR